MKSETFVLIIIGLVLSVVGYLLKDFLRSIKMQLKEQGESIRLMVLSFNDFKIDLVKIDGTLANIIKKQSEAGNNIKEAKNLAYENQTKIAGHDNEINNLKVNYTQYHQLVLDNADKIKKIEDEILVHKAKSSK
jgi:predicted phage tail protein